MKFTANYSAVKYVLNECLLLLLFAIVFMVFSWFIALDVAKSEAAQPLLWALFAATVLLSVLSFRGVIYLMLGFKEIRGDWRIDLDDKCIRLLTPSDKTEQSFEIEYEVIKRISLEAFLNHDDNKQYKWFIYFDDAGREVKKKFACGPFAEEIIANKLQHLCGVRVVVDEKGGQREWSYKTCPVRSITVSGRVFFGVFVTLMVAAGVAALLQKFW